MPATQPSRLLGIPAELRVAIYDALFAPISADFEIKNAIGLISALQICRTIRCEALPVMLHFVELRVAALGKEVDLLERDMRSAEPPFSILYEDIRITVSRYRDEHLEFQVLAGVLRIMQAVREGGVQLCDEWRRAATRMQLWSHMTSSINHEPDPLAELGRYRLITC